MLKPFSDLLEFFSKLFDPTGFTPRAVCGDWTNELIAFHNISDVLIWLSYLAIPVVLIYFARHRRDLPFPWMFWMFGAFIIGCGFTHFMEVVMFYNPVYRLAGLVKFGTAVVSVATVIGLIPLIPKALALRGPAELEREVAERKKSEEALRESEMRLRWLVEGPRDFAIFMLDLQGNVASWNPGAEAIKGYKAEEIIGQHFSRFYLPEDQTHSKPQRILEKAARDGRAEDRGWRLRKDGSRFFANTVITALRDEAGKLRGFSKVTRDITEQKRAEDALEDFAVQRATLAELGQRGLEGKDLDALLNEAALILTRYLGVEFSGITEIFPEKHVLWLRAGVGWKEGWIGQFSMETGSDMQAGYALLTKQPVIAEDLRTDRRFRMSELQREHAIVSSLLIAIPGADGPIGVLGVQSTRQRIFTRNEITFVQAVAHILGASLQRKRTEDALQKSRAMFQGLFEFAPDAIVVVDRAGTITRLNAQVEQLFGYSREALLSQPIEMLLPERLREIHIVHRDRYLAEPRTRPMGAGLELHGRRKDGSEFPVDIMLSPVETEEGSVVLGVIRDITERKQAEAALKASAEERRLILDTAYDAFIAMEDDGRIAVWNRQAEAIFGWTSAEAVGRILADTIIPPRYREHHVHGLAHYLATGEENVFNKRLELLGLHRDGHEFPVELTISPLRRGHKWIFNAFLRDITERKQAEEALAEKAEQLARSNEELERFASVASHDLQEPLRKIQAFGDKLKSRSSAALSDEGVDSLNRMLSAAGRMRRLIEDLLAFSRVTSKARPPEPVDLGKLAREAVADLEGRIQHSGGNVEVDDLPAIDADPLQIRQLFVNLIGNGLKFQRPNEAPMVKVTGELLPSQNQPDTGLPSPQRCQILVQDNGIGFDEKYLDRIFEVFQRLHTRDEFEGTGMGLAICRRIVERHGGTITARSKPGQGATFIVTLPVKQEGESAA